MTRYIRSSNNFDTVTLIRHAVKREYNDKKDQYIRHFDNYDYNSDYTFEEFIVDHVDDLFFEPVVEALEHAEDTDYDTAYAIANNFFDGMTYDRWVKLLNL